MLAWIRREDMDMQKQQKEQEKNKKKYPWTAKRVIALAAILLLVGLYALLLVSALLSGPGTGKLFRFCLGMTIAVPIFAWIAIYAAGFLTHRHTIASPDILNSNPRSRKKMEDALAEQMEKDAAKKK
jgi:hypothetical protein